MLIFEVSKFLILAEFHGISQKRKTMLDTFFCCMSKEKSVFFFFFARGGGEMNDGNGDRLPCYFQSQ